MVASATYLEAAKAEQLERELTAQGYVTERAKRMNGSIYDLVAERGDERIAIEVKAQSRLAEQAREVTRLRERAFQLGFTEFRLVVVNPPRARQIEVEGLDSALRTYLVENPPSQIDELSGHTLIEDVSGPEIDEIEVTREGTRVAGDASLELLLQYGEARDGATMHVTLPFRFDVILGLDGEIIEARSIEVDTASLHGD